MYQNMTREEMIQRLYEGNFTTGELERQLIAKLFEQCCGDGSSAGGGGGSLLVNTSLSENALTMDKTAKEIWEAIQSSAIMVRLPPYGEYDEITMMRDAKKRIDESLNNLRGSIGGGESEGGESEGGASKYLFDVNSIVFVANADDEYPYFSTGA